PANGGICLACLCPHRGDGGMVGGTRWLSPTDGCCGVGFDLDRANLPIGMGDDAPPCIPRRSATGGKSTNGRCAGTMASCHATMVFAASRRCGGGCSLRSATGNRYPDGNMGEYHRALFNRV